VLAAVGATPLIELGGPGLEVPSSVRLFAKLEAVNPGASIKDRPVSRIITRALAGGELARIPHCPSAAGATNRDEECGLDGRRLLDSSSGNAGIAYAMFGALLGVGVTLVIPGNASRERLARIRAHGAEVILTDPVEGYDFAVREAERIGREQPERYWYANQYANPDNWRAHYETTGVEILEQLVGIAGEAPACFVAGVGTGGTITGVGRRLREARPDIHIACIVPDRFPGIEGLKPLGAPDDLLPPILDESLIDERIEVSSEQALDAALLLARRGLFVGPSSGAYVHAALQVARRGDHSTIVTMLNDAGERYASTGLWGS